MRQRDRPARSPGWLVAATLVLWLGVAVIWWYLKVIGPFPGDALAHDYFGNRIVSAELTGVTDFFGGLGTAFVAVVTVATCAWVLDQRVGRREAVMVVAAAAAVVANELVRLALGPSPNLATYGGAPRGHSFPSGHVVYSSAVFGLIAVLGRRHAQREVTVIAAAIVLLMGPMRVLAVTHYPSDVLAGLALGLGWMLATIAVLDHGGWWDRLRARRA